MAGDLNVEEELEKLMAGAPAAEAGADDPESIGVMPNEEQIQEYIRKLQESMARKAEVAAPLSSIPPVIFIIAFIVFFAIIGWFSYKLIKSLSEKERKREEKRKLKEMKKKK